MQFEVSNGYDISTEADPYSNKLVPLNLGLSTPGSTLSINFQRTLVTYIDIDIRHTGKVSVRSQESL